MQADHLGGGQLAVEFVDKTEIDFGSLTRVSARNILGCLGFINIEDDIFLVVVAAATTLGNILPNAKSPHTISRIDDLEFISITSTDYDEQPLEDPDMLFTDVDPNMRDANYMANQATPSLEHPCASLKKLVSSGTFYFTPYPQWDISTRLSELLRTPQAVRDLGVFNERFIWNEYLVSSLLKFRERLEADERLQFDKCQFIILTMQGYAGISTTSLPSLPTSASPTICTISLISRLSCKRAGTRFNTRGVDDDGNVANFVETEMLFASDDICFSYVQARGSVPLFWEQQGFQSFGQRIQITRSQAASQPAFEKHFAHLQEEYASVHAINLLGGKENEATLTSCYFQHLKTAQQQGGLSTVRLINFDFHNQVKTLGHENAMFELKVMPDIADAIDQFGFFSYDLSLNEVVTEQKGVFRANCLDCLDRTNFVQDILARAALEQYLTHLRRTWSSASALWGCHRELWAENGDALSRIYAGTGALNTSYTRSGKRTLAGVLSDATKSVSRAYINNFQDKGKQQAIDLFLGNLSNQRMVEVFDPIHEVVRDILSARRAEYSTDARSSVFVGTWNLNGRAPSGSILPWISPFPEGFEPDIIALGVQEIVPLTAQQIVQTDISKKATFEKHVLQSLEQRPNKRSSYTMLRSEQLVGTVLLILVKSHLTPFVRNVESSTRKTGLRGMSGNKGGVGIRLDYHDTSLCFITAHLAAGHENVAERNSDYHAIEDGVQFLRGKSIQSHQHAIWLADTNYRIDMDNSTVRDLAREQDYDALLAADQLKREMDTESVFGGYEEGPVQFAPTYRYDLYSDNYDTSEKFRIPAWTDRILYRGEGLKLLKYSRAELKSSDHRPVYALFDVHHQVVDHAKRESLYRALVEGIKNAIPGDKLERRLAEIDVATASGYPDPSSDTANWWHSTDHPEGVFVMGDASRKAHKNPWDSPSSTISTPSSTDEDLYNDAASLRVPEGPIAKSETRRTISATPQMQPGVPLN